MSRNRVIGRNNQLPWSIPSDLQMFKKITQSHPVVMGRSTYHSIGRPLPRRHNIVLSSSLSPQDLPKSVTLIRSPEELSQLKLAAQKIFIIGGATLFRHFLPMAQEQHLTTIATELTGDTFYPEFDPQEWTLIEQSDHHHERDDYSYIYQRLIRRV